MSSSSAPRSAPPSVKFSPQAITNTDVTSARFLVIGPPKSGKTTLATTCPKPVLFVDPEGGFISIRGAEGIFRQPVSSWEEYAYFILWLESQEKVPYRTLFIDSFNVTQGWGIEHVIRSHNQKVMQPELWGIARKQITDMLGRLKAIQVKHNMLIVITCGERTEGDAATGAVVERNADIQGTGGRNALLKDVDGIFFVKKDTIDDALVVRVLTIPYGSREAAGHRFPGLLAPVEVPDIGLWMNKIAGKATPIVETIPKGEFVPEPEPVVDPPADPMAAQDEEPPPADPMEREPEPVVETVSDDLEHVRKKCVDIWEALLREMPHKQKTIEAKYAAVLKGLKVANIMQETDVEKLGKVHEAMDIWAATQREVM